MPKVALETELGFVAPVCFCSAGLQTGCSVDLPVHAGRESTNLIALTDSCYAVSRSN